ncbi:10568_t:CDS:2 [Paraglomus brasilianum]|uniref:10568_t:CDS:1 n=1 Tax=Paraglomus brasilianum TaxID=144538 RepID=A0A9N9F9K4_9GLOM|nr:10568_t:CDS:2 [Paraglomus brasilianum]
MSTLSIIHLWKRKFKTGVKVSKSRTSDIVLKELNSNKFTGFEMILMYNLGSFDGRALYQQGIISMISCQEFYQIYALYLGDKTDEQLIEDYAIDMNAVQSLDDCIGLVKKTLDTVRDKDDPLYGAKGNEYLNPNNTGLWDQLLGPPLSMADYTSGFNVTTCVSWYEELSSLTEEDVLNTLRPKIISN